MGIVSIFSALGSAFGALVGFKKEQANVVNTTISTLGQIATTEQDTEKAKADVLQIIETGKTKGKGFILSTACSIAPKVTKERLLMLSQMVEEHGQY